MKQGAQNRELGSYVRQRRQAGGLDIRTVAERSGFHGSYWRKLEAGHYLSPDAKYLQVIAEVLDCPYEDLYALCGYKVAGRLPSLGPYLRATSDLDADEIAVMERIFDSFASQAESHDERRAA